MRIFTEEGKRAEYELFKAVQDCNLREVRRLLREGANPNLLLKRKGGLSPFHLSVGLPGHNSHALEIVAVLLDSNADPNNRAFDGLTPLHIAAMWGHLQAVELLVNSDADIELCDNEGKTALMLSRENRRDHVTRYLDKLQRHIITAVCEAEEACLRMENIRNNQAVSRQSSNILSQSEESDCNSVKNANIKLNIQPQRTKTDAFTQCSDRQIRNDKIRWSAWAREVITTTSGIRKFTNAQNLQTFATPDIAGYSGPLTDCLRGYPMKNVINQADSISKHSNSSKHYFNYLLLDSKYTKNLPCRAGSLPLQECFRVFCSSLFHVGCGNTTRPLAHLQEAKSRNKDSNKIRRIRSIWSSGHGVISLDLHGSRATKGGSYGPDLAGVSHGPDLAGVSHEGALTRQAIAVSTIGLNNVTNTRGGILSHPYNSASQIALSELGVVLLFRTMLRYLSEGEQLWYRHQLG